ncbi:MAG: NAD(P)-dependent oxidoreductase [Verrucomicrobia bacterium]|nr:NAD(P)-dependent oxidoreductase [Verrucomicrobiota bacterium]
MPLSIPTLVTGSAGRIGRAVVAELQRRGHQVRGFDRVPASVPSDHVTGDLTDRAALERAMQGIECLIHLAATPDDVDDVLGQIVPDNIAGLFHVMEAARLAGVKRLVLASSGQVNWGQQMRGEVPVRVTDPPSPKYWYAASKMFLEAIGCGFAETHGISVIVARLGWCPRTLAQVEEIAAAEWAQDVYLSPGDAGRFFACAVEAPPEVRHLVVYAASRPVHRERFDLSETAAWLGYEPEERWPQGIEVIDKAAVTRFGL